MNTRNLKRRRNIRRRRNRAISLIFTCMTIFLVIVFAMVVHGMIKRNAFSQENAAAYPTTEIQNNAFAAPDIAWQTANTALPEAAVTPDETIISGTVEAVGVYWENAQDTSEDEWKLLLVNRWNPLPEDYEVVLVDAPGGVQVDSRIYEPLIEMLDAATEAGVGPIVVSGYRTQEKQQQLYDEKISEYVAGGYSREDATARAQQWVSIPGTSEHQTGLAVDINGMIWDVYPWLAENSYRYGFILRYPEGKTDITGAQHERWHFRYVGMEAAREIYDRGLCLEEYVNEMNP